MANQKVGMVGVFAIYLYGGHKRAHLEKYEFNYKRALKFLKINPYYNWAFLGYYDVKGFHPYLPLQ